MKAPKRLILALLIAAAVLASSTTALPASGAAVSPRPGTLDRSFGKHGKVIGTAPPATVHSDFKDAAREPDGNLVLSLEVEEREGPAIYELEVRTPTGALDPSFGKDGVLTLPFVGAVATLSDGDILASTPGCDGKGPAITLFDPSGAKVTSFGDDGCAQVPLGATQITTDPQGRILLVTATSYCEPCGHDEPIDEEPAVERLLPNGSLDPSFGKGGVVHARTDLGLKFDAGQGWEPSGLIATNEGGLIFSFDSSVVRLDEAGALVPGFGKGGVITTEGATAGLVARPDGNFLLGWTEGRFEAEGSAAVTEFGPTGTADASFGSDGTASLPLPTGSQAVAIAPAPDEGTLVAVASQAAGCTSCDSKPLLVRLTASGQIDPAYGTAGIAELPVLGRSWEAGNILGSTLLTAADGSALLVGSRFGESASVIARTPTGAPDSTFGEGGQLIEHWVIPAQVEVSGLTIGPKGEAMVAAEGESGAAEYGGFLTTFSAGGRQRRTPSGARTVSTEARGQIQSIGVGRVVSLWPGGSKLELLNSADSAGDPVKGFGKKGAVELPKDFSAWEIVPAPKGGVAVVGEGSGDTMAVYRLGRSGRPLAGFGHRGLATVSFGKAGATAVTGLVEPDGDVVLTGSADGGVATVRLLPNGRPDPSFGNGGRVVVTDVPRRRDYGSEVASWDGGVVIAVTSGWAPYTAPGLIRLDRHGHQVHDFGRKGLLRLGLKKFVLSLLTGGGRIVAMTEADGKYRGGVELHAYNANGTIDRQFGDDGVALAGTHQKLPFQPVAAVQQPSGKITVAGTAWHGEGGLPELLRFR